MAGKQGVFGRRCQGFREFFPAIFGAWRRVRAEGTASWWPPTN